MKLIGGGGSRMINVVNGGDNIDTLIRICHKAEGFFWLKPFW
jgi:hypothetical protein